MPVFVAFKYRRSRYYGNIEVCVESSYSVSALFSYLSIKMDQGTPLTLAGAAIQT